MLCPATSTGMDGGGGGRVGCRAGQAGLASCLMTSLHLLPQWAPTNLPPCSLGTMGSCRELCHQLPLQKAGGGGGDSNASLSWASGPPASSVQAMGEAQQLVGGPTLGCISSSFCILQGTLPRGSPTFGCYLLIMVGGRQEERAVQGALWSQDLWVSVSTLSLWQRRPAVPHYLPHVLMNDTPKFGLVKWLSGVKTTFPHLLCCEEAM